MIDTLKVKIDVPESVCIENSFNLIRKDVYNPNTINKYENFKNYYHGFIRFIRGLYKPKILIFPKRNAIYIEYSVPKLIYGHNIAECTKQDIIESLRLIKETLLDSEGLIPPVESWKVLRFDLCRVLDFGDEDSAQQFINSYSEVNLSRMTKQIYTTGIAWYNNSVSLKFYRKFPEFMNNRKTGYKALSKKGRSYFASELKALARGKVRFELAVKSHKVKRMLSSDTVAGLLDFDIDSTLLYYRNQLDTELPRSMNKLSEVHLLLKETYGSRKGQNLFEFYLMYYHSSSLVKNLYESSYSQSHIYLQKRLLRESGILDISPINESLAVYTHSSNRGSVDE